MVTKILSVLCLMLLCLALASATTQMSIRAGYWSHTTNMPASEINSALYTHLICVFDGFNSSSNELLVPSGNTSSISTFTNTVKLKNPSITTILSIKVLNYSTLQIMASSSSARESFIGSSIMTAKAYGFQGVDLWLSNSSDELGYDLGSLFQDWREAIASEAADLILTASVYHSSAMTYQSLDSLKRNLDWVHVLAFDYNLPNLHNSTAPHAPLYEPKGYPNTDFQIGSLINGGLPANKLVLGLPLYGYAWTLSDPIEIGIGAPSKGSAITADGSIPYQEIRSYIKRQGLQEFYDATYVVNYCASGSIWIGFDGLEAVRAKVTYAKKKELRGYAIWQVSDDDNWDLSRAALGARRHTNRRLLVSSAALGARRQTNRRLWVIGARRQTNWRIWVIVLAACVMVILFLGFLIMFCIKKGRLNKSKGTQDLNSTDRNLLGFSLATIEKATNGFSNENKIGEGGYGPVYKGVLRDGEEIAVKKLSRTSQQGIIEFKNEVNLTAQLQHVNLVKLLGYCVDGEERMLVYEYMPMKSLDYYLFDPIRKRTLDWGKRVVIIEGIIQGLVYLQEYSRLTIIHRDLKASNILLDRDMKPKISDLGMARIFAKNAKEANTSRIVGTPGYIPPEYVHSGVYSTKLDVYSFGILLLQILTGKNNVIPYGSNGMPSLQQTAYELWKDGKGQEVLDQELDDTFSSCKLMKCLQVALLCVQEYANDRPSMLEVSSMLKNETAEIPVPKEPAFSPRTNEVIQRKPIWYVENVSADDSTMTISDEVMTGR